MIEVQIIVVDKYRSGFNLFCYMTKPIAIRNVNNSVYFLYYNKDITEKKIESFCRNSVFPKKYIQSIEKIKEIPNCLSA